MWSILNSFGVGVLKSRRRDEKPINFFWFSSHWKFKRQTIRLDHFYALTLELLNRFKTFIAFVYHLYKSNSSLQAKVCLACSIKPVLFITFYLTSPSECFCVGLNQVIFESWSDWTIDRSKYCMVSAVGSQDELMILPKFPDYFGADYIFTFI